MVAVERDDGRHTLRDLTVSITLSGDLDAVHTTGDNANVVPTDTQKNTVFAFAKEAPIGEIEEFALRLGRHFVAEFEPITRARVAVEVGRVVPDRWRRTPSARAGREVRIATAVCERRGASGCSRGCATSSC